MSHDDETTICCRKRSTRVCIAPHDQKTVDKEPLLYMMRIKAVPTAMMRYNQFSRQGRVVGLKKRTLQACKIHLNLCIRSPVYFCIRLRPHMDG